MGELYDKHLAAKKEQHRKLKEHIAKIESEFPPGALDDEKTEVKPDSEPAEGEKPAGPMPEMSADDALNMAMGRPPMKQEKKK